MKEVTRFEDLKCWQAARALTKLVYQLTKQGLLAKDYELAINYDLPQSVA